MAPTSAFSQKIRSGIAWAVVNRSVRAKLTATLFLVAIVPLSILAILENKKAATRS